MDTERTAGALFRRGRKSASDAPAKRQYSSRIAGIHFGADEIGVALCGADGCTLYLRMPAICVLTETGEVLTGRRAARYRNSHPDTDYYSVYQICQAARWQPSVKHVYKGIAVSTREICLALMKELRGQMDAEGCGDINNCVVSVSSCSNMCREEIRAFMQEAGFEVKRVLQTSVACALSRLYQQCSGAQRSYIACTLEGDTLELSLLQYGEDVLEVYHTTERLVDRADYSSGENVAADGFEQMQRELSGGGDSQEWEEMLENTPADLYLDQISGYLMGEYAKGSRDLVQCAAFGAAVQGAKLDGSLKEETLLLDITPIAYGIEILSEESGVLLPLQWIQTEQCTVPTRSDAVSFRRQGGEEILKLHMGHSQSGTTEEVIQMSFTQMCGMFARAPEKVELKLFLDMDHVSLELSDPDGGEKRVFGPWHYPYEPPVSRLRVPGGADCREPLPYLKKAAEVFEACLMERDDAKDSEADRQGLRMIEGQCRRFLKEQEARLCVGSGRPVDDGADMESLLEIAYNLEYALRSFTARRRKLKWLGNFSESRTIPLESAAGALYQRILIVLVDRFGVQPIEAEGQPFDPSCHFAAVHEQRGGGADIVLEELERGYRLGSRILRPSKVKTGSER